MFSWTVLPVLIFFARVVDVSIGTLRIIFVSRSKRLIAPLLGIFESIIWLLAVSQIMQNVDNFVCIMAYGLGFAAGNYVGILIEEKLALGTLIIRVFLVGEKSDMKDKLYEAGFGVTSIDAHGRNGNVVILYTIIKRRDYETAVSVIEQCRSDAFYSVEEVRSVRKGIFPPEVKSYKFPKTHLKKHGRKRK